MCCCAEHRADQSFNYPELLKKDEMEEEANVFAILFSSLFRVATGIKPTSETIEQY